MHTGIVTRRSWSTHRGHYRDCSYNRIALTIRSSLSESVVGVRVMSILKAMTQQANMQRDTVCATLWRLPNQSVEYSMQKSPWYSIVSWRSSCNVDVHATLDDESPKDHPYRLNPTKDVAPVFLISQLFTLVACTTRASTCIQGNVTPVSIHRIHNTEFSLREAKRILINK